jgi:hypothetical protein
LRIGEERLKPEEKRGAAERRELLDLRPHSLLYEGAERRQIRERSRLNHLLDHSGSRVALHQRLPRVACIFIVAHGAQELLEVEILILEGMREFVCQNHLLHVRSDPAGDKHCLRTRIIKAGCLLGIERNEEIRQIEFRRDQAKSFQDGFLLMDLPRTVLRVQALGKVSADLGSVHNFFFKAALMGRLVMRLISFSTASALESSAPSASGDWTSGAAWGFVSLRAGPPSWVPDDSWAVAEPTCQVGPKTNNERTARQVTGLDRASRRIDLVKLADPSTTSTFDFPGLTIFIDWSRTGREHLKLFAVPCYHIPCASKLGDRCPAAALLLPKQKQMGRGREESPNSAGWRAR